MKNLWIIIALIFGGSAVLAYPYLSSYYSEKNTGTAVADYAKAVSNEDDEKLENEWKIARQYNENMTGNPVHDPFVPGTGLAVPDNYMKVLDLNQNEVMGTIEIPRIGVDLPIYHGTDADTLKQGIGHLEGSTLPIGGEGTHAVLSGHSGLPTAKLFTDLEQLEKGDLFYLNVLDEKLAYKVDQIKTVLPDDVSDMKIIDGKDYVTLVTCTPYGINSHRLLVRGERTAYDEKVKENTPIQVKVNKPPALAAVSTTLVMAVLLQATLLYYRRKGRRLAEERLKSRINEGILHTGGDKP